MTKVCVVHPYRRNVHKMYQSYFFEPERAVQMATHLDESGIDVDFIDFGQTNLDDDHHFTVPVPREIRGHHNQMFHYGYPKQKIRTWFDDNGQDYDLYIVDALTPYFREGVEFVVSRIPGQPVLFFGEWPQLVPEDFDAYPAVVDNWEEGAVQWVRGRPWEGGIHRFSFDEYPINDVAAPNWRKFTEEDDYPEPHNADYRASRGCVERCDFCHVAGMYDGRFNFKSPEIIIEDLEFLIEDQGFTKIKLRDDNFCAATNTAKEVFRWIGDNHPDVEIMQPEGMEMRTASRDRDLIMQIGRCNYHSVRVGFETATEGKFSKNSLEWWEQAHAWFKEAGFGPGEIFTFVIRGHPKMVRSDEIHTAIYLSQFDVTLVSGGYRLVPGTELWDDYVDEKGTDDIPYLYGLGLPNDDDMIDNVGRLYRTVTHWNNWGLNLFDDNALDKFSDLSWIESFEDHGDRIECSGTVSGWRRTEGIRYGFATRLAMRGYHVHQMTTDTKTEMEIVGKKGQNKFMSLVMECADDRGVAVEDPPGGLI